MPVDTWRLGHRRSLDSIRGLAIILVVLGHSYVPGMTAGGVVGVTMFFTLSGFLITALLLEEEAARGGIDLAAFYGRRARRLLPALAASVAAVAAASVVVGSWFFSWSDALAVGAYYGNWAMVHGDLGGMSGTWSLAVEEQFYLLWPVVLVLCLRRGPWLLALVAAVGFVACNVRREALWASGASPERIYYASETHADALLVGCLIAVALHGGPGRRTWQVAGGVALALVLLMSFSPNVYRAPMLFVPALCALTIYALCRGDDESSWLHAKALVWVGRRSYGIYLWHCPMSVYLSRMHPEWPWTARLAVYVLFALPLTVLSWRFVEQPFMRRRSRAPAAEPQREDLTACVVTSS